MNQLDTQEEPIVHVIDDYCCGDDFRTVEVIVVGCAFDVQKTVELINAAPALYTALDAAIDYVCASVLPSTRRPETIALIDNMQRAAVAARGGVLQRDRMVTLYPWSRRLSTRCAPARSDGET
jgi:hypothetical protein